MHQTRGGSNRADLGVEPICTVLRTAGVSVAPSTYYAAKSRAPSKRACRDAVMVAVLVKLARALDIPTLRLIHLDGEIPDLRALRLKAGLTVPELASRTNMAVKTYYSWEVGRWTRLPSPSTLEALGRVFDEPADVVAAAFNEAQRLRRRRPKPGPGTE